MSSQNPGCLAALFGVKPKVQKTQRVIERPPATVTEVAKMPVPEVAPFAARGNLLSNAEVSFFHVLRDMTKDFLVIFPHIAMRDLISVIDQSEYFTHFNRIKQKQVDFVLCDPKTLKPVFAIELDDSTHQRPDRIERDAFVEKVFADSKIPLVRVPVSYSYDPKELGKLFQGAIQQYVQNKNEISSRPNTMENPPFCPKHGIRMILRTANRTGEKFWGCPNYPACREVIKLQAGPG